MGKRMRPRRSIRDHASLDFQLQAPGGIATVRAMQQGGGRYSFYYVTRRGVLRIRPGVTLDAAQKRLDELFAAEDAQWIEFARLQEISEGAKTWRRFVWLRVRTKTLTDGYRKLIPTWVPVIGGRLWIARKPKHAAREVPHAA